MPRKKPGYVTETESVLTCPKCEGAGNTACNECGCSTKFCRKCMGTGKVYTGVALREARVAAGISIADVCKKLGLSRQYLSVLEGGHQEFSTRTANEVFAAISEIVHERTMAVAS